MLGDVMPVGFETLEMVRSIGELDDEGDPASDSGKEGS